MSHSPLPELRVQLFGGPLLFEGDHEVPLSPFQSYLLALVYGHGPRGISRAKAAWLLWEEDDNRQTRQRLGQLRYTMAKKVGGRQVVLLSGTRLLRSSFVKEVDTDVFQQKCRSGRIDSASFSPQSFLERVDPAPSESYDTWRLGCIADAARDIATACATAWDEAESRGDWSTARQACASLVDLQPDDVALLPALARLYLKEGAVHAAYATAKRAEALDLAALSDSPDLTSMVLGYESEQPDPFQVPPTPAPLIGRDQEVAEIFNHIRSGARAPRPVVVVGESGIGKTRTCEEALARLANITTGLRLLRARCVDFEGRIALNAIIEAIHSTNGQTFADRLEEPWRSASLTIFPGMTKGGPLPPLSDAAVPRRLLEAIRRLLAVIATSGPMVIFIDDFQWIDGTSIAALQYLLRRWDSGSLRLLLTCRAECLVRPYSEAGRFIQSCLRDGAPCVSLKHLDFEDAFQLMKTVSSSMTSEPLARALFQRTGGNPLFIVELCREAQASELRDGSMPMPSSVQSAIAERLSQASEGLVRILQVLTLAGAASPSILLSLADMSLSFSEILEEGMQAGLLRVDRTGAYAVKHDLIEEVIRSRLSDSTKQSLHAAIGRALLTDNGVDAAPRIATHLYHGGLPEQAFVYALAAANRAEAQGAVPEAIRFLRLALQCNPKDGDEAEVLGRVAHLTYLQTDMVRAAPLLARAATVHKALGRTEASLTFSVQGFNALSEAGGLDHRTCIAELDGIAKAAIKRGLGAVFIASLEAKIRILERLDQPSEVQEQLAWVREAADQLTDEAAAHAHMLLALEVFYGSPTIALQSTARAYAIAHSLGKPDLHLKAALRRFLVLIYQGAAGSSEGLALMNAVHEETRRTGDIRLKHTALVNEGVWHLEVRNLREAERLFREAEAMIRGVRTPHDEINRLGNLGATYLELGDVQRAERYFRKAEDFVDAGVRRIAVRFLSAGIGLCLARQGRIHEARRFADRLASPPFWYFDPTYTVLLKAELFRARGDPTGAIQLLTSTSNAIRDRMIPQWLTLQEHLVRLLRRHDTEAARATAIKAHQVCVDRQLTHRAGVFKDRA